MEQDYSGHTEHARQRCAERGFTSDDIDRAIKSARESGTVTRQEGKYGTLQQVYAGTNGLTAVVETSGRNAGKVITAWWSRK